MKTNVVVLDSNGTNMQLALDQVEGLADGQALSRNNTLHLRLLADEVLAVVRLVVTDFNAKFWTEGEGNKYKIILEADVDTNVSEKSTLLSLSTTGKNEADLGLGQKIARIFRRGVGGKAEEGYSWSLDSYKKEIKENPDPSVALDNMEKSVIANLASDVRVRIKNGKVRMVVEKVF